MGAQGSVTDVLAGGLHGSPNLLQGTDGAAVAGAGGRAGGFRGGVGADAFGFDDGAAELDAATVELGAPLGGTSGAGSEVTTAGDGAGVADMPGGVAVAGGAVVSVVGDATLVGAGSGKMLRPFTATTASATPSTAVVPKMASGAFHDLREREGAAGAAGRSDGVSVKALKLVA